MRQVRVTRHVQVSSDHPDSTESSSHTGVGEAGDEKSSEEGGVVLGVVGVRALRAVEAVCIIVVLGHLVGGVSGGVGNASCLAELASVEAVDGVEDEGGGCGEDNVSVLRALAAGLCFCHCLPPLLCSAFCRPHSVVCCPSAMRALLQSFARRHCGGAASRIQGPGTEIGIGRLGSGLGLRVA